MKLSNHLKEIHKMKKSIILRFILSLFLLFTIFLSGFSKVQGDSLPPILESLEITPQVVGVGEKVYVSAKITDDVSGVKQAQVSFTNNIGSVTKFNTIFLEFDKEKHLWVGEYIITQNDLRGSWQIEAYQIEDHVGNRTYKHKNQIPNYQQYYYIVDNPKEVDVTPPLIEDIKVTPRIVKVGQEFAISIKLIESSDIRFFQMNFEMNEPLKKEFHKDIKFIYDEKTGYWVGKYKILPTDFTGFWKLKYVTISDIHMNLLTVEPMEWANKEDFIIQVINPDGKEFAPKVNLVEITPREATVNEKVVIKVKVDDNNSVVNSMYVQIAPPNGNSERLINLYDSNQDGVWEGTYRITKFDEKGKWNLKSITAHDTSFNFKQYFSGEFVNHEELNFMIINDIKPPASPAYNQVNDRSQYVTGITEPDALVTITIGNTKFEGVADTYGNFNIPIPQQLANTLVSIIATDEAGNISKPTILNVLDKTPPAAPKVNIVSDVSKDISGKSEVNSKITLTIGSKIYRAVANEQGDFKVAIPPQKANTQITVTATDDAGNISEKVSVSVLDKTPPAPPKVNSVKSNATVITGKAEPFATITIKFSSIVIGTATAEKNGLFKVKIKKQKKNRILTITAKDKANNVSKITTVKVQ
jgi:hypothetical protein